MSGSPQRRILTTLVAAQVVGGIGNGAGLAVGALLIRDVTGSTAFAGAATLMLTLGAAIATLPLAAMAARRGRRPALTCGWIVGSLGAAVTILGAQVELVALLAAGLICFGASTAANLQSRFAATDQAAPDRVAGSLSLVMWATTIGAVSGPNLIGPGSAVAQTLGLRELAGPVVFSTVAFALAGMLTWVFLRPDPLETRENGPKGRGGPRDAWPHLRGETLFAVLTIGAAHAVMVAVMSLTPVHMDDHGGSWELIGFTISIHIAGMYALSPVFGWMSDRFGARPLILLGQAVLAAALILCATAGGNHAQVGAGLVLLGVGWSAAVIAGAALVTVSTRPDVRPAVQGTADLTMNVFGATGALMAGVIVATWGFAALNWLAFALVLPVVVGALAPRRPADVPLESAE